MTNPLELYEIAQRVGYFIQIHKRREDHRYWHFDFHPKDLISCLLINKTWRQALTPLLWRVYNEEEMIRWKVPQELCQVNSPYFWYMDIDSPWPIGTMMTTQLRELTMFGRVLKSCPGILQSNRLLTRLSLKLYDGTNYSDIQEALDSISWLRTLQLHGGDTLNPDHLTAFIFNNQDLKELLVTRIKGFERIVSKQLLMNLTSLDLDTPLDGNPGLVQLIRFCPNLESIWFHGNNTYDTCPLQTIATNLRECCPKISSIRSRDTFFVTSDENMTSEEKLIALIQSSCRLTHFDMPILDLSFRVCQALLDPHMASLQLLRLNIFGVNATETLKNAGRILALCPNLETFVLSNMCADWRPMECLLLLDRPWSCKNLGAFTLTGVRYSVEEEDGDFPEAFEKDPKDFSDVTPTVVDTLGNVIRTANGKDLACSTENLLQAGLLVEYVPSRMLGKHGWVVQVSGGVETEMERKDLCSSGGNKLVGQILQRTISLAKIRKVTINDYRYCKAGSPELRKGM